jgi:hypothetical protein
VDEAGRVIRRQHFQADKADGQPNGVGDVYAGNRRRVAQGASLPEDSQRLREAQGGRVERPHPSDHPAPDSLKAARQQLSREGIGHCLTVQFQAPQQFAQIEWIAAAGPPQRFANDVVRSADDCGADQLGDSAVTQQGRMQQCRRLATQS